MPKSRWYSGSNGHRLVRLCSRLGKAFHERPWPVQNHPSLRSRCAGSDAVGNQETPAQDPTNPTIADPQGPGLASPRVPRNEVPSRVDREPPSSTCSRTHRFLGTVPEPRYRRDLLSPLAGGHRVGDRRCAAPRSRLVQRFLGPQFQVPSVIFPTTFFFGSTGGAVFCGPGTCAHWGGPGMGDIKHPVVCTSPGWESGKRVGSMGGMPAASCLLQVPPATRRH